MLDSLIKSKTRLRLLVKFFVNIANTGYLNGLALELGESTNSIRTELNNLTSAKYLKKKDVDNKVVYSANQNHPLFPILQRIVRKHLGLEQIVEKIFNEIGKPKKIVLIGDYAKGLDSGVIEILIVGNNINKKYLDNLENKLTKLIDREVVFLVSNRIPKTHNLILFES